MYTLELPALPLRDHIENYWFVVTPPGEETNLSVDVFVDARADLIVNLGDAYRRTSQGRTQRLRASNVDAQRLHPITIQQRGNVVVAGARFRTAGLSAFVPSVHAWTNRVVRVSTAFGREAARLEKGLLERVGDSRAQTALLDAFFLSRLDATLAKRELWALKARIEAAQGLVRIDELSRDACISVRHMDRLFREYLGMSPKVFARVARFQSAINLLKGDPGCALADVAAQCGYYDQSHLVHEFKRFAGSVPKHKRGYFPPDAPRDFSPNLVHFFQDPGAK